MVEYTYELGGCVLGISVTTDAQSFQVLENFICGGGLWLDEYVMNRC